MSRSYSFDDPVQMHVDEVLAGRRAPMAEQPRLDVLRLERLPQQRVVEQIDLADRQVVRGAPVRVHARQEIGVDRGGLVNGEVCVRHTRSSFLHLWESRGRRQCRRTSR